MGICRTLTVKWLNMSKTVLVIDDDDKARKLYRVILERIGYNVVEASGALEGIRLAEAGEIQLIFLDIQLPEVDGRAAARILKAYGPTKHIPIIAVTALVMPGDREEVLATGIEGYLPKPVRVRELRQMVRYFLEEVKERED
jgi:two-component system cell cycle response regulator DivK